MQITKLHINDYKILDDFEIEIDQPISVFIGVNGSGKSSLLEAIVWIFSCANFSFVKGKGIIEKKRTTPFEFKITYIINLGKILSSTTTTGEFESNYIEVTLSGKKENVDFYEFTTNNSMYTTEGLIEKFGYESLFPERINVYYSGISAQMQSICNEHLLEFKTELKNAYTNKDGNVYVTPRLPFYYFEPKHFPLLLAALFSYEYNFDLNIFFQKHLSLSKPENSTILIQIKKRLFRPKENHTSFWGAEGELKRFLGLLQENSVNKDTYNSELEQFNFIFDLQNWYNIKDEIGDEKRIFELLYLLDVSELLEGINVFCTIADKDISYHHISEGQKQKIIIRAFYELLQLDNSILILDEPDTFLHPQWQDDFIMEVMEYAETSTYFITTHSPILISNLKKGDLFNMSLGKAEKITGHYFGKEYSDNLQDLMHTGIRNNELQEKLNELFDFIDIENYTEATKIIDTLEKDLGDNDPEILRAKTLINFYTAK